MRSLLFVPADSERKLARALAGAADALILDLEDSITAAAKPAARQAAREFLEAHAPAARRMRLLVRVNALDTDLTDADLAAVLRGRPDGIMLPKCQGAADVTRLVEMMRRHAVSDAATPILPIATETAEAMFGLGSYRDVAAHLLAMTWGGEDLAADIGAAANRDAAGQYTAPFQLARSLLLFGASAASAAPLDSVYPAFRDRDGLRAEAIAGCRDGFTGKLAIHPDQVEIINEVYTPDPAAVARARHIVRLFADSPDTGALQLDGEMLDLPHLKQAHRLLRRV
jgi:citrate lyase subunit beta/citryl-CoA lyase